MSAVPELAGNPYVAKHLPGKHDQSAHAKGGSAGGGGGAGRTVTGEDFASELTDEALARGVEGAPSGSAFSSSVKEMVVNRMTERMGDVSTADLVEAASTDSGFSPLTAHMAMTPAQGSEATHVELHRGKLGVLQHSWDGAERGTPEAELLVRKAAVSSMVETWASSSNDSSDLSLHLQDATKRVFGTNAAAWPTKPSAQPPHVLAVYDKFVKAQYDETQSMLKARGITEFTVYRGVGVRRALSETAATQMSLHSRPMSSWSTDPMVALGFATHTSYGSKKHGIVMRTTVPASKVISTPVTGVGCFNEREIVVLGGKSKVSAVGVAPWDGTGKWGLAVMEVTQLLDSVSKAADEIVEDTDEIADWVKWRTWDLQGEPDDFTDEQLRAMTTRVSWQAAPAGFKAAAANRLAMFKTGKRMASDLTHNPYVVKHLPGKHDQSSHSRGGGSGLSTGVSASILERVKENGGLSVNMLDGSEPTSGYMVAKGEPFAAIVDAKDFFDPTKGHKALGSFMKENKETLGTGKSYLGVWHNTADGKVYLDVSDNIASRAAAVAAGSARNQISIWDVANFAEINTGGTGQISKGVTHGRGTAERHPNPEGVRQDDGRGNRRLGVGGLDQDGPAAQGPAGEVANPYLKHAPGKHNQADHARGGGSGGGVGIGSDDMKLIRTAMDKRTMRIHYNEGYESGQRAAEDFGKRDAVLRAHQSKLGESLDKLRNATEGDDKSSHAMIALNEQGFLDGYAGSKRKLTPTLTGFENPFYSFPAFGKAAEENPYVAQPESVGPYVPVSVPDENPYVVKHLPGKHDQSSHNRGRGGAGGGGGVPALDENVKPPEGKYSAEAVAEAAALRGKAEKIEPEMTATMQKLAEEHGGKLEGLEYRLKGEDSLARKIDADAVKEYDGDRARAAGNISDSVRYTMVVDDDNYTAAVGSTIKQLESEGYSVRAKNFWKEGDDYQGINAKATKDGVTVELQFHTPASLGFKEGRQGFIDPKYNVLNRATGKRVPLSLHAVYENYRTATSNRQKWGDWSQMVRVAAKIPKPANYAALLAIGAITTKVFEPLS